MARAPKDTKTAPADKAGKKATAKKSSGAVEEVAPVHNEKDTDTDTTQADRQQPPISVLAQYIKDFSFEAPGGLKALQSLGQEPPEVKVDVRVQGDGIEKNVFEVVLTVLGECQVAGKPAYVVELTYGGLFVLNVAKDVINPALLIECPRLLFPFARNIIADVTRDGGYPPLLLENFDFVSMYHQAMEENVAQSKKASLATDDNSS